MVQQFQQPCANCSGTGYATPASDSCGACKGKCIVPEKKTFEVGRGGLWAFRVAGPGSSSSSSSSSSSLLEWQQHQPAAF
jgi:hypothetical protein